MYSTIIALRRGVRARGGEAPGASLERRFSIGLLRHVHKTTRSTRSRPRRVYFITPDGPHHWGVGLPPLRRGRVLRAPVRFDDTSMLHPMHYDLVAY